MSICKRTQPWSRIQCLPAMGSLLNHLGQCRLLQVERCQVGPLSIHRVDFVNSWIPTCQANGIKKKGSHSHFAPKFRSLASLLLRALHGKQVRSFWQ